MDLVIGSLFIVLTAISTYLIGLLRQYNHSVLIGCLFASYTVFSLLTFHFFTIDAETINLFKDGTYKVVQKKIYVGDTTYIEKVIINTKTRKEVE